MDSNEEKDLFGDSEDEDQQTAPLEDAGAELEDDNEQAGAGDRTANPRDLFGSEDESDEDAGAGARGTYGRPQRPTKPLAELSVHLRGYPDPSKLRVIKLSNILNIESRPFDPDTFVKEEESTIDSEGRRRVNLRHLNTVRWRAAVDPATGRVVRESNARFVRWSDGSMQLFLGDEPLNVAELVDEKSHHYLFVRQAGIMQGQARLATRLQVHPASLHSKLHRSLRTVADRQHARTHKVKATVTLADPKAQTKSWVERVNDQVKAREQLNRSQQRVRNRSSGVPRGGSWGMGYNRGPAALPRFNAGYLDEDDEDEEAGEFDAAAARAALTRGRRGALDDEEAERRLAAAKRGPPMRTGASPGKRPRYDDEEDEELSDLDDVGGGDNVDDFIVDDDEELSDDDDRPPKSGGKGGGGGGGGRRGVILDDDDDD